MRVTVRPAAPVAAAIRTECPPATDVERPTTIHSAYGVTRPGDVPGWKTCPPTRPLLPRYNGSHLRTHQSGTSLPLSAIRDLLHPPSPAPLSAQSRNHPPRSHRPTHPRPPSRPQTGGRAQRESPRLAFRKNDSHPDQNKKKEGVPAPPNSAITPAYSPISVPPPSPDPRRGRSQFDKTGGGVALSPTST